MRIMRHTLLGLAVMCLIIGFGCTIPVCAGSYSDPVSISIPYTQDYSADSKRAGDVFTYQIKTVNGAPAPQGSSTFSIKATNPKKAEKGTLTFKAVFPAPGEYQYQIKAQSGPKVEGVELDQNVYTAYVLVKNNSDGGLVQSTVKVNSNKSKKKVESLTFNPKYNPPTAAPTKPTRQQPTTVAPTNNGNGGNGGNGGNARAAAPAAAPAAQANAPTPQGIDDGNTPLADIGEDGIPQAAPDQEGTWAILNLLLMIATALLAIILVIRYFGRIDTDADEYIIRREGKWRLAGIIPAVGAIVAFILTETIPGNQPVLTDEWTPLMAIIFAVAIALGIFAYKHYGSKNGEQTTGAQA